MEEGKEGLVSTSGTKGTQQAHMTSTSEMLQGPLAGTVACMAVVHQERIDACFGGLLWEHLHC